VAALKAEGDPDQVDALQHIVTFTKVARLPRKIMLLVLLAKS